jgi:ELWxxDGT repeat protein
MNRLLSRSIALIVFGLLVQYSCCTRANNYAVRQVSNFMFAGISEGGLKFEDPRQIGNQLFFKSHTSNGVELFRTDGTGITEYDVNPGKPSSAATWFHIWKDTLYFAAYGNNLGWELYSTTGGAPALVADIVPGPESSSPGHHSGFAELGDHLYFFAGAQGNFGLYRTSGVGVEYVARAPDDSLRILKLGNGSILFTGNGDSGVEFYRTDGHTISILADVNPGPASSNPQSLFEYAGNLYFKATGPHGTELFKTDGTSVIELDINPGLQSSNPTGRVILKNELYFNATRANGGELFKTNGTTITEFDINPGPSSSTALIGYHQIVGDRLYLAATGPNGKELFATDGTSVREYDINPGAQSSDPLFFVEAGDALYFRAQGPEGIELYRVKGSDVTLLDLYPGPLGSKPSPIAEFHDSLYVIAAGQSGVELFQVNGTEVTEYDIFPGSRGSSPSSFVVFNDDLFFSAMGPNGRAVYRTDGTTIEEVFNAEPHSPPSIGIDGRITNLVPFQNSLLFMAETSRGAHLYQITVVPEPVTLLQVLIVLVAFSAGVRFRSRC